MADQTSDPDNKTGPKAGKPLETPAPGIEQAQADAAKEREEEGGYQ